MTPLGPNIFWQDSFLSLKLLLGFSDKTAAKKLEDKMSGISFNAGRVALMAILKSLDLPAGSEVLIQGYTCVAVPDAVLWANLKPVFVDIDEKTFNMDPKDLEKKITPRAKVIVAQHTFGISAPMNEILKIAKNKNLFVIEDCAHGWPDKIKGDAAFFSFGKDKVISGVFGGLAVIKNQNLKIKTQNFQKKLNEPSIFWVTQQLLYNPLMFLIIKTYDLGLGKLLHFAFQKLNLLSKAVLEKEKIGRMPDKLAQLALLQLERLDEFNKKRLGICQIYRENLKDLFVQHPPSNFPLLRYTILVDQPKELMAFAKKRGVYLGNWYDSTVAPRDTDLGKIGYKPGSCPKAEKVAAKSVNLLTNPNMSFLDVEKIIQAVKDFYA